MVFVVLMPPQVVPSRPEAQKVAVSGAPCSKRAVFSPQWMKTLKTITQKHVCCFFEPVVFLLTDQELKPFLLS